MKTSGFTLIEILLVVVIIGIMSIMGINIISSQSNERQIMNDATMLEAKIKYICDLSILENRAHGIEWTENGLQVLKHQAGDWVVLDADDSGFEMDRQILLNGLVQTLEEEIEELPHVICQPDGSFNAFEVKWPAGVNKTALYYSLRSETPYQLVGTWLEK